MFATRGRALIAALAITGATALAATTAGPVQAAPGAGGARTSARSPPPPSPRASAAGARPTGLTDRGQTPEGSQLTWTASTDDVGVVGYNVYFFDGWYTSLVVATTTGTSVVAQSRAGGLQNGSFYVRARDAAGNLSIASDNGGFSATWKLTNAGTLSDVSWNRVIPPGGSVDGGFLAWGNSTTTPPSSATLGGNACRLT